MAAFHLQAANMKGVSRSVIKIMYTCCCVARHFCVRRRGIAVLREQNKRQYVVVDSWTVHTNHRGPERSTPDSWAVVVEF